jgi:ERCC4-related helicase
VRFRNKDHQIIQSGVTKIIWRYVLKFRERYPECRLEFCSAKVVELIKLLDMEDARGMSEGEGRKAEERGMQKAAKDKVVVFVYKRRTVKYLYQLIKNYLEGLPEHHHKYFSCGRVTGYSIKRTIPYNTSSLIDDNEDPLSHKSEEKALKKYDELMREYEEYSTDREMREVIQGAESPNIASEMKRLVGVKHGRLLLEVEEKYTTQIEAIKKFRNHEFRVLITTSVTEEGFDIPECKMVVSFDRPSSLKSYIQIKGRARERNSRYIIFTT